MFLGIDPKGDEFLWNSGGLLFFHPSVCPSVPPGPLRSEIYPLRTSWADSRVNWSPKGNMWSAIPVALLCLTVNWSERKQGSDPKPDKVL